MSPVKDARDRVANVDARNNATPQSASYEVPLKHPDARERRLRRKAEGRCINSGPLSRVVHGPPIGQVGKCQRCIDIHRGSRDVSVINQINRGTT